MPGINKLLDEAGEFAHPETRKRLEAQAAGFVGFVEKLRGKKLQL